MLYKRVELTEGQPVQFIGVYATRWPYDSGTEPTVGFIEANENDNAAIAIAAAVQSEREANCSTICPKCAGKFDTYRREAVLVGGLWVHKSALDESIFSSVPCDAAAIRARSNGAGRE